MKEIKVRQRWIIRKGWYCYDRFVVVISISGNTVIVLNEDTLRKSILKKKTFNNSKFFYSEMMRKSAFKSLLKRRERNIK